MITKVTSEHFSLIYSVEDRKWDELLTKLNALPIDMRDLELITDKVVWLRAQTDFNHIVEMTCQLIRELLALHIKD